MNHLLKKSDKAMTYIKRYTDFKNYKNVESAPIFNTDLNKVYGLIDPENNELFYVGCTRMPMVDRVTRHLRTHYRTLDKRMTHKLNKLNQSKTFPIVVIYCAYESRELAESAERALIIAMSQLDYNVLLLNGHGSKSIPGDLRTTYLPSMKTRNVEHEIEFKHQTK